MESKYFLKMLMITILKNVQYLRGRLIPLGLPFLGAAALLLGDGQTAGTQATSSTINIGAPTWSQFELSGVGEAVSYYKYYYDGSNNPQNDEQTASTTGPRPPVTLHYLPYPGGSPPSPSARSVCSYTAQSSPALHWFYPPNMTLVDGDSFYVQPNEEVEYTASGLTGPQYGFEFKGSFSGQTAGSSPAGAFLSESVYFTDRVCSDGGNEYGFLLNPVQGQFRFYWSIHTNCGGDDCQSGTTWNTSNSLNQQTGWVDISGLSGSDSGTEYRYHVYIIDDSGTYKFRFEVLDPTTFALQNCSFNGGSSGYCGYTVTPDSWFPISSLSGGYGYTISTAATSGYNGNPNLATSPSPNLTVNAIWAGK